MAGEDGARGMAFPGWVESRSRRELSQAQGWGLNNQGRLVAWLCYSSVKNACIGKFFVDVVRTGIYALNRILFFGVVALTLIQEVTVRAVCTHSLSVANIS
jgi:hypothetical protein